MCRIAISSISNNLDGKIDPRFGRASGFIIFNLDDDKFEYLDNGSSQVLSHGAGIKTASKLAEKKIKVILTGFIGPKAYKVLEAANIEIVQDLSDISVRDAIDLYKKGNIVPSTFPKGRKHGKI